MAIVEEKKKTGSNSDFTFYFMLMPLGKVCINLFLYYE